MRPVALRIGRPVSGHFSPYLHISILCLPYSRLRLAISFELQTREPRGCSNKKSPPLRICFWICWTQNRNLQRFSLISLALSNGVLKYWIRFSQPPSWVHGGQTIRSAGLDLSNNWSTWSWIWLSKRSHPCFLSKASPLPPCFCTSRVNLGGEKSSATVTPKSVESSYLRNWATRHLHSFCFNVIFLRLGFLPGLSGTLSGSGLSLAPTVDRSASPSWGRDGAQRLFTGKSVMLTSSCPALLVSMGMDVMPPNSPAGPASSPRWDVPAAEVLCHR